MRNVVPAMRVSPMLAPVWAGHAQVETAVGRGANERGGGDVHERQDPGQSGSQHAGPERDLADECDHDDRGVPRRGREQQHQSGGVGSQCR